MIQDHVNVSSACLILTAVKTSIEFALQSNVKYEMETQTMTVHFEKTVFSSSLLAAPQHHAGLYVQINPTQMGESDWIAMHLD